MHDIVIAAIMELYHEPLDSVDEVDIEKRAYQDWAALELINRLMDHPFEMAETVLEDFVVEMTVYHEAQKRCNKDVVVDPFREALIFAKGILLQMEHPRE